MQTLDLYIKNGLRIDIDTIMLFDIFGQTQLILILDLLEFLAALESSPAEPGLSAMADS